MKRMLMTFLYCLKDLHTLNVLVATYTVKNQSRLFSFEIRKNGTLPSLDVNIYRESGQFVANFYNFYWKQSPRGIL